MKKLGLLCCTALIMVVTSVSFSYAFSDAELLSILSRISKGETVTSQEKKAFLNLSEEKKRELSRARLYDLSEAEKPAELGETTDYSF